MENPYLLMELLDDNCLKVLSRHTYFEGTERSSRKLCKMHRCKERGWHFDCPKTLVYYQKEEPWLKKGEIVSRDDPRIEIFNYFEYYRERRCP